MINIEQLIMLVAIFFIIYFLINVRENFDQLNKPKRECSQSSINDAYNDYVFGGFKFVR